MDSASSGRAVWDISQAVTILRLHVARPAARNMICMTRMKTNSLGNTDHQIAAQINCLRKLAGQYSVPVLQFTLMIEPEPRIAGSTTDDLDVISHCGACCRPAVRFATIEETAQA